MLERLCQLEALEAFASVHLVSGTDHHNRKKLCPSLKLKFCTVYQITSRLLHLKLIRSMYGEHDAVIDSCHLILSSIGLNALASVAPGRRGAIPRPLTRWRSP
jgi:hypothetical protein